MDIQSNHAEAQAIYDTGLKYYPTNFALLNNKALSLALSGQMAQGTSLLEELVRDPERGQTAQANLALVYSLEGRNRDARALLKGLMTPAEVEQTLRTHQKIRSDLRAGKPAGHLAF